MNILNSNIITTAVLGGMTGPEPPLPNPIVDFVASSTGITAGDSISFTDLTSYSPTSWQWQFPGGTPTGSTGQNPSVTYGTTGTYNVTLTATNVFGPGTLTKTNYIHVVDLPVEQTFTSNGTWNCCPGVACIEVIAVGGGGGGAAGGARGIADLARNDRGIGGGAGGGGGAVVLATITGAQLTSSVCVVIGCAGSGGGGVSAPASWPGCNGSPGCNGGNTCFGGFVLARGGKASPVGGCAAVCCDNPPAACPGQGGTGSIFCGTGTICIGGNGGGQNAQGPSCLDGLPAANVSGTTRAPGAGAGGSMWYCSGIVYEGCFGDGQPANTVSGLQLGSSGRGGGVTGCCACPPANSAGYGAGGAGSAASCLCSAHAAGGRPGVIKVIQYFA